MSTRSPAIPMMTFMGVRISWLMLARKSLFARLPASAASLAARSSCSVVLCPVTSTRMPRNPTVRPSRMIGLERTSAGKRVPSARVIEYS